MKKISILLVLMVATLLMVTFSFAQGSRDGTSSEGKTTFTNISVVGLNRNGTNDISSQGLPGYIEMTSTSGSVFYLYIDSGGLLRIASEAAVGVGASPSIVGWGAAASAPLVGEQAD